MFTQLTLEKLRLESQKPDQALASLTKDINHNWKETHRLLADLQMEEVHLALYLWRAVDRDIVAKWKNFIKEIAIQKGRVQRHLYRARTQPLSAGDLNSIQLDLTHQLLLLKLANLFCHTLLFRQEKRFGDALNAVQSFIKEIEKHEQHLKAASIKVKALYASAYNHKAKIHRALAGLDVTKLNKKQVKIAKLSYKIALKYRPHSAPLMNGLGCLLQDWSSSVPQHKRAALLEKALDYHRQASYLDQTNPWLQHSIGYALFAIEQDRRQRNEEIDKEKLAEALDRFHHTLRENPTARLHLDIGLTYRLLKQDELALRYFNQGLALDPNYVLLRYERGCLWLEDGEHIPALQDLKYGRALSVDCPPLKDKFDSLLNDIYNAKHTMRFGRLLPNELNQIDVNTLSNLNELDIRKIAKRAEFEAALRRCNPNPSSIASGPSVFISYAWGVPAYEKWVEELATDLELSGFNVLFDRWQDKPRNEIMDFIKKLPYCDYVIVVGTKGYLKKNNFRASHKGQPEHFVRVEMCLIDHMFSLNRASSRRIIPIILEGSKVTSLPIILHGRVGLDFTQGKRNINVLNLIQTLSRKKNRDAAFLKIKEDYVRACNTIRTLDIKALTTRYDKVLDEKIFSLTGEASLPKPPPANAVIVDTDIGTDIDDTLALLYFLTHFPNRPPIGITTSTVNPAIEARIAKLISEKLGFEDVPVYAGVGWTADDSQADFLSKNPLWPSAFGYLQPDSQKGQKAYYAKQGVAYLEKYRERFSEIKINPEQKSAAEFIVEQARKHSKENPLTLLCLGPLHNVYEALKIDEEIASNIRLYTLGGEAPLGYNWLICPQVTAYVLARIETICISASLIHQEELFLTQEEFETLQGQPDLKPLAKTVINDWLEWAGGNVSKERRYYLGDPTIIAAALDPRWIQRLETRSVEFPCLDEKGELLPEFNGRNYKDENLADQIIRVREEPGPCQVKFVTALAPGLRQHLLEVISRFFAPKHDFQKEKTSIKLSQSSSGFYNQQRLIETPKKCETNREFKLGM